MKNILLIGVGGTGSNAVSILNQQIKEFGKQTNNRITMLVFDTDAGSMSNIGDVIKVPMSDTSSVGTICDRIGTRYLNDWFPSRDKAVRAQELVHGASQWRKKSFLAFMNLMNKPVARSAFIGALEQMAADPQSSCEVYVVASIAGGTGSGSFIPIALYAKRYLREHLGREPLVNAMIALPDIYADSQTPDNKIKVYSNAYAILRELNAINCVAYNYNANETNERHSTVKMRIGHPDEPNVGLLFDASDRRFWTPEAAPFNQVFLLDRIPGLHSISAHDIVMANSLYTLICTEIGAEFDSEASNHAILHSQSNGSNAIYAGISTSQIRFPKETVLDYLARTKAVDSCTSEWMKLHRKTEKTIRDKIQLARDCNDKYVMQDGEYAELVLAELINCESDDDGKRVVDIVDRCTAIYDKDGKKKANENTATEFFDGFEENIDQRLAAENDIFNEISKEVGSISKKFTTDKVAGRAAKWKERIDDYYMSCVDTIKKSAKSMAEAVLSFDDSRDDSGTLVKKALMIDGKKYIHPVAAMVQLCRIKQKLIEAIDANGIQESDVWDDIKKRVIDGSPERLLTLSEQELSSQTNDNNKTAKKSAYAKSKDGRRFINLAIKNKSFQYFDKGTRTDAVCDAAILDNDAKIIIGKINKAAVAQLKYAVYTRLSENVNILIEKYRTFFSRFEKEKEGLVEETKTLAGKDVGTVDSLINVYCSEEDKKAILKEVLEGSGPESEEQLKETDDISGRGVFNATYRAAVATVKQDENWNEKDTTAYHSLFDSLIASYHEYISKTDAFQKIAAYNVVEAIEASNRRGGLLAEQLKDRFQNALALAAPSLKYNADNDNDDLVIPTSITVFMMSTNTAKYIKRFADRFQIKLPSNRSSESSVIRACAEEFIRKYSGSDTVRVSIVDSMSDDIIYCTSEVMDISPLRIPKFAESNDENTYYKQYCEALRRFERFGTDMWNPHLGENFHSRGNLPYINPAVERECDKRTVKALIWALCNGDISYGRNGMTYGGGMLAFRYTKNGHRAFVMSGGNIVRKTNIAKLMEWLRDHDTFVEAWSRNFDKEFLTQLNALPNIATDNENDINELKNAITGSQYMRILTNTLFCDPEYDDGNVGPGLIELAYLIRVSEESDADCDDAERILAVAYDIFMQFCEFRANRTLQQERFIQIYTQQLNRLFEELTGASIFRKSSSNNTEFFTQFANWINDASLFLGIPGDNTINEHGELCINKRFTLNDTVKNMLSAAVADSAVEA